MMPENVAAASTSHDEESVFCDVGYIFQRIMLSCSFYTWDKFQQAFNEFMKESNTSYRIASSLSFDKSGPIKYKYVKYECTFGGERVSRGCGLRNRGSKSIGCRSQIAVSYTKNKYRITLYKTVHNHPCTEEFIAAGLSRRRLSEDDKVRVVVQPLIERNANVQEKIMNLTNQRFDKVLFGDDDVRNLRSRIKENIPPSATSNFRNVYERLRSRIARLNRQYPNMTIREMKKMIRRFDILLGNSPDRTYYKSHRLVC
uniref:FAR1 domain-containing protein n=1 Tax=Trichobilharzia regenti TaxID=157069 RepID=A0AA85IWN4_TRIRE|nr:unnamed protein product [Trichobilharzia regenti]